MATEPRSLTTWQTFAITTDFIENPAEVGSVLVRTHAVGYADGTQLRWHAHDWHQLVFATSGVVVVETAAGAWTVPPARAVWVPAGVPHRLKAKGRVQLRTVYVTRGLSAASSRPLGVIEVGPLLRELILHLVDRGTLGRGSPPEERLASVLLDLLHATEVAPLDLRTPTDPVGAQVAALLRARPGADLDAIASEVGASRRTIERRFREQTGLSLGRWRQRLQLVIAIELLANGTSVSDAGWQVGYSSTSAFVTAFRHRLGTTPGRYFTSV